MIKASRSQLVSEEELRALLRRHGIIPTGQRLEIATTLFRCRRHLSAEQILREVREEGSRVSKATVYNTLGLFAAKGLIRTVIVDPTRVFYDPNTSEHHHFYDVDTGTLADIDADELTIGRLPRLPDGVHIEGVDVIVRIRTRRD